jgi:hypothetical protein
MFTPYAVELTSEGHYMGHMLETTASHRIVTSTSAAQVMNRMDEWRKAVAASVAPVVDISPVLCARSRLVSVAEEAHLEMVVYADLCSEYV